MSPNTKSRLLGLLIFAIGVGGAAYTWYSVLAEGRYAQKASFLLPFFACLGLSLMIYPMSKAESLAKYGSEQIPWEHIPMGQKVLIFLGVVLGALQWSFFSGHLSL
ncbi:hypothetical protein FNU76_12075 [Chitinimonas arctica]|uniref:Uncharacterized protein n=1 Tax=Chitinimonas arctica TaxID=2594795 RepID=A0A516SG84_9NEIS|nr:hypothetical protein [Chitinimonas arctica]QDQ27038.1 hypothetical protein FNU76_12075 [Chitinimonas arctica]